MGIPGLIVTEEMVPKIQEILETAGIKVAKEEYPEEREELKVPDVPDKEPYLLSEPHFRLHCENKEGYRVKLDFGRVTIKPYPLAVAIRPEPHSSFLKSIVKPDKNKLVDEIVVVLKKHGAKDFDEVLENKEQNIG